MTTGVAFVQGVGHDKVVSRLCGRVLGARRDERLLLHLRPADTKGPRNGDAGMQIRRLARLDVLGAAGLGLGVAGLEAIGHAVGECGKASRANDPYCGTNLWFYVPAAVVGASAIYGFLAIAHCSSQLGKDEHAADLAALDHAIEARCGTQSERPKDGVAASGRVSACGH